MSYILEALKKADQEREIGAVPNLATPHETERPQPRFQRWLWIIALLLGVNVVVIVMLLQGRDAEAPVAGQVPPETQAARVDPEPAKLLQQPSEAATSRTPAAAKTVPTATQAAPSSGGLVMLPEPASLSNSTPSSMPEERPEQREDEVTAGPAPSQLQSWYELPPEIRSRLDLPRLDLHVYSEDPQSRFIMVQLKKYREGERLESGLLLEEILPHGMVMSYRGERFLVDK